jgi:hypothetical protein
MLSFEHLQIEATLKLERSSVVVIVEAEALKPLSLAQY